MSISFPQKLYILGYKQHGKDTLAEYLRDWYGLKYESSSWHVCTRFLFDKLKEKYGYRTALECFNDRDNHREEWFNGIIEYNGQELVRVSEEIFHTQDAYVGLRNLKEYEAYLANGLYRHNVVTIWVDAGERKPPESSESCTVHRGIANIVVTNNGTLEEFKDRIDNVLVDLLYGKTFDRRQPQVIID